MNRYAWVTRYSDGEPYRVWEDIDALMRIPPSLLKSCFYIYPSKDSAQNRKREGASGFFFKGSYAIGGKEYVYAVTNLHVIAHCSEFPAILVNGKDGKCLAEPIETSKESWIPHKGGADIAMCQIELPKNADVGFVDRYISPDALKMEHGHVGPGDGVYMIGRFTTHEFADAVTPIVRYGNISLNPSEHSKIENPDTGNMDEVFLVETRSFSGYSGSPVFVYIMRNEDRARDTKANFSYGGPLGFEMQHLLVGINLGHSRSYDPVVVEDPQYMSTHKEYPVVSIKDQRLLSEKNNGMMRIAPAWTIHEMLDYEEFKDMRDKQDKEDKKKEEASHVNDTSTESKRDSVNLISREEFEKTLKKVSRKISPSQSDQPKPKT